ncbi:MAG: hypothetical protein ACRC3H_08275 [Lachnospiraceae bacterium]
MIKIENVSFSYQSEARGSLTNINLAIGDGECVLLCGRSGCGLTPTVKLPSVLKMQRCRRKNYSGGLPAQAVK